MLWGKLNPGPHHVGFKSVWELDTSRPYNMIFEDKTTYASEKSPRPILINIWYPARRLNETRPMRHRDYLAIETEDPLLARFAAELVEFEHLHRLQRDDGQVGRRSVRRRAEAPGRVLGHADGQSSKRSHRTKGCFLLSSTIPSPGPRSRITRSSASSWPVTDMSSWEACSRIRKAARSTSTWFELPARHGVPDCVRQATALRAPGSRRPGRA